MASFTGVGDNTTLLMDDVGETVAVAISGTYDMTIKLQREVGSYNSGAWETLKTYSTADATVAEDYVTQRFHENLRLIVAVDTSGTATATLTDSASEVASYISIKDRLGNTKLSFDEDGMRLHGSLKHAENGVVDVSSAAVTIDASHAGKIITLNRAAGITATLPAAEGTGNVYTFFVGTTLTGSGIIQAASAADSFGGGVGVATDAAGVTAPTAATSDTLTMNGSTTGGIVGSMVKFTDVAAGKFMVEGQLVSTGSEATPFSAAV